MLEGMLERVYYCSKCGRYMSYVDTNADAMPHISDRWCIECAQPTEIISLWDQLDDIRKRLDNLGE